MTLNDHARHGRIETKRFRVKSQLRRNPLSAHRLIEQLKSDPNYNPNETEYKIITLKTWLAELNVLNTAAIGAKPATSAVRAARDAKMYNPTDGIIPRMNMLKSYVSAILPSNDPRWTQLKKLRFVDLSQ